MLFFGGDSMEKEKSCGAVIYKYFDDVLKVLVVKHNSGHYAFSKGHMEKNETEIETAIREIKEETNLDVIIDDGFRFINTYSPKEGVIKDVVYFVATPINSDVIPQSSEIAEINWYDVDSAYDIITYNDTKEILRKAVEYLTYEKENV